MTNPNTLTAPNSNQHQFSSGILKPNRHDFILEVKSRLNKIKTTDKKDLLITPILVMLTLHDSETFFKAFSLPSGIVKHNS